MPRARRCWTGIGKSGDSFQRVGPADGGSSGSHDSRRRGTQRPSSAPSKRQCPWRCVRTIPARVSARRAALPNQHAATRSRPSRVRQGRPVMTGRTAKMAARSPSSSRPSRVRASRPVSGAISAGAPAITGVGMASMRSQASATVNAGSPAITRLPRAHRQVPRARRRAHPRPGWPAAPAAGAAAPARRLAPVAAVRPRRWPPAHRRPGPAR